MFLISLLLGFTIFDKTQYKKMLLIFGVYLFLK